MGRVRIIKNEQHELTEEQKAAVVVLNSSPPPPPPPPHPPFILPLGLFQLMSLIIRGAAVNIWTGRLFFPLCDFPSAASVSGPLILLSGSLLRRRERRMKDEARKSGQRREKDEIFSLSTQQKPSIRIETEGEGNKEDEERKGKERKGKERKGKGRTDYNYLINQLIIFP